MTADMNWSKAIETGKNGGRWKAGASKIKPVKLAVSDSLDIHGLDVPMLESAVVGFRPNVPAYLCGSPYSMFKQAPMETPNRLIKVAVNVTKSGTVGQSASFIRGNAVLSVITALATHGFAIELWAVMSACNQGNEAQVMCKIKPAESVYSADSIAFALANDAFFRRLTFAPVHIAHKNAKYPDMFDNIRGNGWGTGDKATYSDFDVVFPWFSAGDRWTESGAVDKAKGILEKALKVKWGQA
jgi:hypothetical protein